MSGTVQVWDWALESFPSYKPVALELDKKFEELHPGVTIEHVAQPFETYETLYRTAFASHEVPDVMQMGNCRVFEDGLETLNPLLKPSLQNELSGWSIVTKGFSEDGPHCGVPIGSGGGIFYYNKELFAKAGLPAKFEPKTWKEVLDAGEKLKAAGIQPFTGGNKEGYENGWWFNMGWQTLNTEQQAKELAEGKMAYTDEAVAKAFGPEFMMQEAGLYPTNRFSTPLFPDGAASFGEEGGAMFLGLKATAAYYGEWSQQLGEKNIGMFLAPGSTYSGTEAEWLWSVPKDADNKGAAVAYIEFLASKEGQKPFVDKTGMLPNRHDLPLPPSAPIQAKQLLKWGNELNGLPPTTLMIPYSILAGPLNNEINQALQGRISLAEAQQSMQEAAEKEES